MPLSLPISNPFARRLLALIGLCRSLTPPSSPQLGFVPTHSPRLTRGQRAARTILCCSSDMAASANGEALIAPQPIIAQESSAPSSSTLPEVLFIPGPSLRSSLQSFNWAELMPAQITS